MATRIRFGRRGSSRRGGSGKSGGALGIGIAIGAVGLVLGLLAWTEGHDDLLVIAVLILASGLWIALLYRVVPGREPALAIVGGLFAGWSLVGGIAAAYHRQAYLALACTAPLYLGLLLLGVLPVPVWARRPLALLRKIWPGLVFMLAGVAITFQAMSVGPSEGVPPFVAYGAGGLFFLGGVLITVHLLGGDDTVLYRTLVALLITGLGAAAVVFPPALMIMAPIVMLAWIAVGRKLAELVTGNDPLASWSQEKVLGLGCGVTMVLALALVVASQFGSCTRPAEGPLPLEAPEPAPPDI